MIRIATSVCLALISIAASAQIVPPNENILRTVQISGQFNSPPDSVLTVYTVPAGRAFRITDLIFTNYGSAGPCDLTLSGMTYEIRVQPSSTWTMNLVSGPTYTQGQKVNIENTWRLPGHDDNCEPIYTIMGYLYALAKTP
jgi:hypothetical protein